jgi:AcrR family transcriptional regulator
MPPTAPRRRTQEERKAESERQIIRAARELFAKQGYMRTTLNEVGKAAGYTGGLVTHRFGSKEGLLNAVVDASAGRFFEDQIRPVIEGRTAEAALAAYIATYLQEISKRESHMRALYVIMGEAMGAVPEIRKKIAELNKGFRNRIREMIERGVDSGEFNSAVDKNAASLMILGLLRGVTMQILADRRAFDIDEVIPMVQRQVLLGLR